MDALLRDLAEPYASRTEQADLSFSLEIVGDSVEIKGDAAQLGTLIQNLLDNAIKFTPAGGQVNVELSTQNEAVQLSVTDTGIGIPGADMPICSPVSTAGARLPPTQVVAWGWPSSKPLLTCTEQASVLIAIQQAQCLLTGLFHTDQDTEKKR